MSSSSISEPTNNNNTTIEQDQKNEEIANAIRVDLQKLGDGGYNAIIATPGDVLLSKVGKKKEDLIKIYDFSMVNAGDKGLTYLEVKKLNERLNGKIGDALGTLNFIMESFVTDRQTGKNYLSTTIIESINSEMFKHNHDSNSQTGTLYRYVITTPEIIMKTFRVMLRPSGVPDSDEQQLQQQ